MLFVTFGFFQFEDSRRCEHLLHFFCSWWFVLPC